MRRGESHSKTRMRRLNIENDLRRGVRPDIKIAKKYEVSVSYVRKLKYRMRLK